MPPASSASMN
jgi:hypothetical protein